MKAAYHAVVEAKRDGRGILHVDVMPTYIGLDRRHALDLRAAQISHKVKPVATTAS